MSLGLSEREELRIDVTAMNAEIEHLLQVWGEMSRELHFGEGCPDDSRGLCRRLRLLQAEVRALEASLAG